MTGDKAVIVDPGDYLSHLLFYELLAGDHRDREIDIQKVDHYRLLALEDIEGYLSRGEPVWIRYQRRYVAHGRKAFAVGREKADRSRQLGLKTRSIAHNIHQITSAAKPPPGDSGR